MSDVRFSIRGGCGYRGTDWVVDDAGGCIAGSYPTESEAAAARDRWTEANAHLLVLKWENAPEGADDSHRGYYRFSLDGCRGTKTVGSGWHSMEASIRFSQRFRDNIAAHGIDAARAFWDVLENYV